MTPAEFLALVRHGSAGDGRAYQAMHESEDAQTFLTFHIASGMVHSLAYSQLTVIIADERGGSFLRLVFRSTAVIRGENLQSVITAVRTRRAADLYEFDADRHNPPGPGKPVVRQITFEVAGVKKGRNLTTGQYLLGPEDQRRRRCLSPSKFGKVGARSALQ
jgi:hypothetical protein